MARATRKPKPRLPEDKLHELRRWLEAERDRAGFKAWPAVGDRYDFKHQELTMVFSGKRNLSPTVALRLAKAFRPTEWGQREFTRELCERASIRNPFAGTTTTVLSRVVKDGDVNAAFVVSEPLVFSGSPGEPRGFAIDFFRFVCGFLELKIKYGREPLTFPALEQVFQDGTFDIVVSAILPSVRRSRFMDFSRPLPFLRLPVSAVVRSDNTSLAVTHFLDWQAAKQSIPALNQITFLLVNGEVGHEFVHTFLEVPQSRIIFADALDPPELYRLLSQEKRPGLLIPDVLVADMSTCEEVRKRGPQVKALPDDGPDPTDKYMTLAFKKHAGKPPLPPLAVYPIAFGLPKGEDSWKKVIDEAIDSVLSEGLRPLLHRYEYYMKAHPSFAYLCTSEDENVTAPATKRAFESLFDDVRAAASSDQGDPKVKGPRASVRKAQKSRRGKALAGQLRQSKQ